MSGTSPTLFPFPRVLKPVFLFAGAIYFSFFSLAGSQVVKLGSVVWHSDLFLPLEVLLWVFFAVGFVFMGFEEAAKL